MSDTNGFDPTYDFTTEAEHPDKDSPTLRAYHKLLWSKPIPSGELFDFDDRTPDAYLHAACRGGEFFVSSDTSVPTWSSRWSQWLQRDEVLGGFSETEREDFDTITYQMGAMMIFPARQVDGQSTLNQARGMSAEIVDRLDLTVECIRLYYKGDADPVSNPLGPTIARHEDFFSLFDDFGGYIDFFLLQDLVTDDRSQVRFFLEHSTFRPYPFPSNVAEYRTYLDNAVGFIRSRNQRMIDSLDRASQ